MFDFDRHFALGVFADRDAVDAEIAAHDFDAGDLLDGQEQRVERPVAGGHFLRHLLLAAAKRERDASASCPVPAVSL